MDALSIISQDHSNLWRLATTVDQVATEIDAGAAIDAAFFTSVFDYIEQFVDRSHHPKEDDFLFRLLRQRSLEAGPLLDSLQVEHREGPAKLRALRDMVNAAALGRVGSAQLTAALRSYTAGLKSHIRTEEKSVLPLARTALLARGQSPCPLAADYTAR